MDIIQQIEAGKLRCVHTNQALKLQNGKLTCGQHEYAMAGGKVPVILKNSADIDALLNDNTAMEDEYRAPGFYQRLRDWLYKDYNSYAFCDVFKTHILNRTPQQLVLSVGGGPTRDGEYLTNLNIGTFPNVDIVGDAHDLPYMNESVDAIYCSAVLEHVKEPITAVREMHRVLKPKGQVLSVIPFMQCYHGYPHHYQNFTIHGHEYLYSSNGFKVLASGTSLGPMVAMTTLTARMLMEYLPRPLNTLIGRGIQAFGLLLRPLDRVLEKRPNNYVLASATYVLAEKL